jgi:hypothetical protein
LEYSAREFLCDEAIKLRVSRTETREGLRREPGNDCSFEGNNRRRPSLGRLHCRHFADMVASAATVDPPTIHDHIKSSSQYKVYVAIVGPLGDQRLTGRNREDFGTIGQLFRQLTIAGDKPLIRESLYAEAPTPFTCEPV